MPLLEMDSAEVREVLSDHAVLGLEVARNAKDKMRPGGTPLLIGAPPKPRSGGQPGDSRAVVGGGGDALQRVAEGVEVDSVEVVEEVAAQADVVGGGGFLVAL